MANKPFPACPTKWSCAGSRCAPSLSSIFSIRRGVRKTTGHNQRRGGIGLLALFLFTSACATVPAQIYEKVFSFTNAAESTYSASTGLTLGSDGNYYGTTSGGGSYGLGTVFKVTPAGVTTILVSFNGANGASPAPGLVEYTDGNFYGTTSGGGTYSGGTIYKVTPGGGLSVLYSLQTISSGHTVGLNAGLVLGSDNNFYGVTEYGPGSNGYGTIFRVSPTGAYTTIADFSGSGVGSNGLYPVAPLIQGKDGNFYGTTFGGGQYGSIFTGGVVFQVTPSGTITVLHAFSGNDGFNLYEGLVQGSDGTLYGVTTNGGTSNGQGYSGLGYGTVFSVTTNGSAFNTLVNFNSSNGATPEGRLVIGADGNIYGTTRLGGNSVGQDPLGLGYGTVFKAIPAGGFTTLVNFNGANGGNPISGLTQTIDGNFIGTTNFGTSSANGSGTVYEMTPAGALTTLASFPQAAGTNPRSGLLQGSDGNFYGTTYYSPGGDGTAFKLTPSGTLTTLANFLYSLGGSYPGQLFLAGDGNFYGTTAFGGSTNSINYSGDGTVFKLTAGGTLSSFVSFNMSNGSDYDGDISSGNPGLIEDQSGTLYGVTPYGGSDSDGTIFSLTTGGVLTTLATFNGTNGSVPLGPMILGEDGNFYGTTSTGGTGGHGTVFEMTVAHGVGTLTTLVNFTGTGTQPSRGASPEGNLIQTSDGTFYGTTSSGGASGDGTVFSMTVTGGVATLTTLIDFSGDGSTNVGANPVAGLVKASDGNFYGTTSAGGSGGFGTIFQMTSGGALTTLYDFASDTVDSNPQAPLIEAVDGNLYGTTAGETGVGQGAIYRLIFPGTPNVYPSTPTVLGPTGVQFTLQANARGSSTTLVLDYGTSASSLNSPPVIISSSLSGNRTTLLGTTLTNLTPGTTYYYQLVATNSSGTTTLPVASFTTYEAPAPAVLAATPISQTSEILNGTVDAFNDPTTVPVTFQLSTDPNFSTALTTTLAATTPPATGTTVAGIVTGNTAMPVSVQADGLTGNTTYFYRISATNAGGTTVSGVQSFTTLTDPMVMATGASLVGTNSAQLNATVDALGAATTVTFVYGTLSNGVFTPISSALGAVQGVVGAGSTNAVVSVNTSASAPLMQGGNYAYEVTATSAGGTATSAPVTFQVEVLSGLTQQFPYYTVPSSTQVYTPPPALGSLQVNLSPPASGNYTPGWRLVGEQLWHASGDVISGLTTGDYQVEYEPASGYNQPVAETVSITSGTTTVNPTVLPTRTYYPNPIAGNLTLQIYLYPQNVGAQGGWRLYDPTNTALWNPSGYVLGSSPGTGLSPGTYLVECEPVPGQITPPLASVVVASTSTVVGGVTVVNPATVGQISYSPTDTPSGVPPQPLSFATITSTSAQGQTLPYAYVGQIRSDVGLSSGFVVAPYVVATAAHVVFDDGTLTSDGKGSLGYVTNLQWLFEREAGTYDPAPQTPRGALVLSSYSADRVADGTPGVSSPTSQNQDVAALYFSSYAGGTGGGYSGYLASDAATNEFLTSTANKILVGYPVDFPASLDPAADQGEMFATPAVPNAFTQLQDGSGNLLEVYSTNALYSFGGNSGGPLCVQYNGANGTYYPAAIYLGESAQAVVRAIDSNVISLFTQAESNGEFNQNFTGGGTTLVSTTITGGTFGVASIQVNLPGAPAGAGWSLSPTLAGQAGGTTIGNLSAGTYTIYYTPVTGYVTPASAQVTLVGGQSSTFSATYAGSSDNTSTGSGALNVTTTTGSGDTADGYEALAGNTSGNNNAATGTAALFSNQTGSDNTVNGASALYANTTGSSNTANGYQALAFNTGAQNTANGANALLGKSGSNGSANTADGYNALTADTTGYANTASGVSALVANTAGYDNTATGVSALQANTVGVDNTANGIAALGYGTGSYNTANGAFAMLGSSGASTGSYNLADGYSALQDNTSGNYNTATGVFALQANAVGSYNTAGGYAALYYNTGYNNTAEGFCALQNSTSGSTNIGLGFVAGLNVTTGSNNIEIGNEGASADAGTIRLGTQNTQTQTFVAGVYGTTGTGGLPVYVLSTGQLVYQPSSAKFKKNIRDMGEASDALLSLRPVTFQYQADPTGTPQYGLVAEEVEKVAPDLVVRDADHQIEGVRYEAVNAMLLHELQKQHQTLAAQEKAMVEQAQRAQEKDKLIAAQQAAILEQHQRAQQKDQLLHSLAARLDQIQQAHGK